jgi:hypothetical protein
LCDKPPHQVHLQPDGHHLITISETISKTALRWLPRNGHKGLWRVRGVRGGNDKETQGKDLKASKSTSPSQTPASDHSERNSGCPFTTDVLMWYVVTLC